MKAKELITKVLVGNPKTIVSIFAVMLLICGIQGIGYAAPAMFAADVATLSVAENQANANVGAILEVTVDAGITLNNSHYNFRNIGRDFASFRLTAVEGGVRLVTRNALDYETQTDYEVIITVRDNIANNGGSAFAIDDEITVTINVTDVSVTAGDTEVANSAPRFNAGPSATFEVPEDAEAGASIGDPFTAMDSDPDTTTPSRDTLTYGLQRGTDAASFDIDSMTGQLKAKAPLDYETKTSYMVIVTVTDGKNAADSVNPAVDDTIRVTIMVTDVNDAPEFATKTATRSVAENTVTDTNIGAPVEAMDVEGNTLTYKLEGTHAASFDIVGDSGQLQTRNPLDYETQTDYEVMVIATDNGDPTASATITVTINVRNVSVANGDDEVANSAPRFNDGPSTTRSVEENTKKDVAFGAPLTATDVDRGDTLTYTLGDTPDAASFAIDEDTGQLKTADPLNNPLDYETKDTYMVTVTVSDGKDAVGTVDTNPVADDTITVTITVTDVNDAPDVPCYHYPN